MLFKLIDKLAGAWLDMRTRQLVKNDPELKEMELSSFEASSRGVKVAIISPAVAHMADALSELLVSNNAKNFVEFEMLPRIDRGKRPIVVTVRYRDGKSAAKVRDEIIMAARACIEYFERNVLNFQYEKMSSYIHTLKCLSFPPYEVPDDI